MTEGAIVELIDDSVQVSDRAPIRINRVKINGADVGLICTDGVRVNFDENDVVTVTLELMPSEVIFRGAEYGDIDD